MILVIQRSESALTCVDPELNRMRKRVFGSSSCVVARAEPDAVTLTAFEAAAVLAVLDEPSEALFGLPFFVAISSSVTSTYDSTATMAGLLFRNDQGMVTELPSALSNSTVSMASVVALALERSNASSMSAVRSTPEPVICAFMPSTVMPYTPVW